MQAGWLVCAQLPPALTTVVAPATLEANTTLWTSGRPPGNGRSVTFVPERLFWLAKRSNSGLDRWFHWGFRGLAGRADESSTKSSAKSSTWQRLRVAGVGSPLGSAP